MDEARLPDSCQAQHGDQLWRAVDPRTLGCIGQDPQLSIAANHRAVQPPRLRADHSIDRADNPSGHRIRLPPQRHRLGRRRGDCVAHQAMGLGADEDLPGPRRLL